MISVLLQQLRDPFMKNMNFNIRVFLPISSQQFSDSSPQGGRKTTQLTNSGYNQPLPCHRISTLNVLTHRQNKSLKN